MDVPDADRLDGSAMMRLTPSRCSVAPAPASADAHLRDAPPLHLEHLHGQIVHLEGFADVRHAAEVRQQVAAERLESFALDFHAQPIASPRPRSPCR